MDIANFLNYTLSFVVGAAFGYALCFLVEKLKRKAIINDDVFRLILSFIVIAVFVIAFIVSLFDRTYEIPLGIYTFVGAVVGYYLTIKGLQAASKKDEDNGK
jgi:ABC-type uncharacterized transport system permease subunit